VTLRGQPPGAHTTGLRRLFPFREQSALQEHASRSRTGVRERPRSSLRRDSRPRSSAIVRRRPRVPENYPSASRRRSRRMECPEGRLHDWPTRVPRSWATPTSTGYILWRGSTIQRNGRKARFERFERWRKRLGVEPSPPAVSGRRPILKTGRATGPRSLPSRAQHATRAHRTPIITHTVSVAARWTDGHANLSLEFIEAPD